MSHFITLNVVGTYQGLNIMLFWGKLFILRYINNYLDDILIYSRNYLFIWCCHLLEVEPSMAAAARASAVFTAQKLMEVSPLFRGKFFSPGYGSKELL